MEVAAVSSANRAGAPPSMECGPGSGSNDYAGYWNTNSGTVMKNTPYSNAAGRIDIEGCCYWGRGVLLTRGSCNIGKLNYYLGARAARDGRRSLYPNIDFCMDPEATCASSVTKELRWTTAMFEWSERVQRYNSAGWAYEDELTRFFDEGMVDDSFIDSVGRIFSRGCHAAGCSDLEVRKADKRKSTFYLIINDILGIDSIELPTNRPTNRATPTPRLTPRPMNRYTTPRPTPQPLYPPIPIGQSPQALPQPPPTNPPFESAQFPTVLYPTTATAEHRPALATPRPIGIMPIRRPSNSDSDGREAESDTPTFVPISETIIVLEGNGAESKALVRWCLYAIVGVSTAHFLLAFV